MDMVFNHLREDKKWESHWNSFLEQMVYQKEKPSFEQAVSTVAQMKSQFVHEAGTDISYKKLPP